MTGALAAARARFRALLHLDDPPRRIALSLAVGVFISCTPFYGLQTLLSLAAATAFRLNKAATVTGNWLNLPWFAPFVYAASLKVGEAVVPGADLPRAEAVVALLKDASHVTWTQVYELVRGASVPLLVGTTLVGALAAAATYLVALGFLRRRRRWSRGV
jgi:hypothetical protein